MLRSCRTREDYDRKAGAWEQDPKAPFGCTNGRSRPPPVVEANHSSTQRDAMNFYIDPTIQEKAPRTRLAVVALDNCAIGYGHPDLDDMRTRVANKVRDDLPTLQDVKMCPQIAGLDQLIGHFDKAARQSSSTIERMLRRMVEEGPMPVFNDAVDAGLLLSLYYKIPVFVTNREVLKGNIGLSIGRSNQHFEVMQGEEAIRTDKRLFLRDEMGIFASPQANGKRGLVGERNTSILVTAILPENVGDSIVRDFLRRTANWFESLCGATMTQEGMVGQGEATDA